MLKRFFLLLLSANIFFSGFAQDSAGSSTDITEQVWKPYVASFANMQTDDFMQLHSHDLYRVTQDSRQILNYDAYAEKISRGNRWLLNKGWQQSIEMRFTKRIDNYDKAYEEGYYKTIQTDDNGSKKIYYGKFTVLLIKEDEHWKILFDTDTKDDVDENKFESGELMEPYFY